MLLSEKLLELRTARGLSQGDLAEKLEVSRQSVSKWETGQSIPDLDKIIKLADLFGVTVDELVREEKTAEAGREVEQTERAEAPQDVKTPPKLRPVGICFVAAGCAAGVLGLVMRPHVTLTFLGILLAGLGLPLIWMKKYPLLFDGLLLFTVIVMLTTFNYVLEAALIISLLVLLVSEFVPFYGVTRPTPGSSTPQTVYVEKKAEAPQIQARDFLRTIGVVCEAVGAALVVLGLMGLGNLLILSGLATLILGLPLLMAVKHPFLIDGWLVVGFSLLILNPMTSLAPWGLIGGLHRLFLYVTVEQARYFSLLLGACIAVARGLLILLLLVQTWRAFRKKEK